MPPSPKPDSERERRNEPQFSWVNLPQSGRSGPAPKLPPGHKWSPRTKTRWAKLWATPQATQFAEDDSELERWALLQEWVWAEEPPASIAALLSELRQIEDRHGLNPKALMQLRWRIVADDQLAKPEAPKGRSRKRYSHLKPVG